MSQLTSDDVIELKGRVACEISSAEELTLTELMFNGVLKDLKVEELVSLLSCFVWQEKLKDAAKPRKELELLFTQLQDTAPRVAKAQLEAKVQTDVESFMIHYGLISWRQFTLGQKEPNSTKSWKLLRFLR
ncbi:hypothetical protein Ddye_000228 [Dipteronia dyeriana]|uniref:ATP-dependent RNA helicase Ski2/MTR4 C-terminal domain-containing protein n=1 Tax=Dipteronia dyeriana TaxID=168575 RepID=A0AAD9XLB1_9ROSI|nr:hypothetical protein Ddye_000228 [Dipteronia dyeriana]